MGYARLELDGLAHQPGWTSLPDDEMRARIEAFLDRHERWVIDGNYTRFRDLIWEAADTLVWLDLPRHVVMLSLLGRTLRRLVTREVLWNGNQETWRNALSPDPDRSVLVWSWTHFEAYRRSYEEQSGNSEWAHLRWERLRTRREVAAFLAGIVRRE